MSFTVTVLGTSAMFATAERAASGFLLDIAGAKLWLDAGSGTWSRLLRHIDYRDLEGVLLTHRHPDHTTDVFMAFHARRYGQKPPLSPIPLWAPQETLDRLEAFATELAESFDLRAIEAGGELSFAGATLRFVPAAHPPVTMCVRIEYDGAVFAYSSDTGPGFDAHALAHDADLFVCEATYQNSDGLWEGHCSAAQAGELARSAGAKRLMLTHLPPGRDLAVTLAEAKETAGDVPVELAIEGDTYEVKA